MLEQMLIIISLVINIIAFLFNLLFLIFIIFDNICFFGKANFSCDTSFEIFIGITDEQANLDGAPAISDEIRENEKAISK